MVTSINIPLLSHDSVDRGGLHIHCWQEAAFSKHSNPQIGLLSHDLVDRGGLHISCWQKVALCLLLITKSIV